MSVYQVMARHYDALTDDVPYEAFADFIEKIYKRHKFKPKTVLDLACGTGSVTILLAQRGYEMIGADLSEEMLARAEQKAEGLWNKPLYLRQSMTSLNLYGTVDSVISCLDSVNYLAAPTQLAKAFQKVSLFLNPGGLFIFDLNTEYKLERLHDTCYIRENGGVYCAWQADWSPKTKVCTFHIDLFEEGGGKYRRFHEEHRERAYSPDEISAALSSAGLIPEKVYGELRLKSPSPEEDRIFIVARKPL